MIQARIFVYGMQSSGASLFCGLLGQIPQSVAIIDLWAGQVAPQLVLAAPVVVLKATVTTDVTLFEHVARFQPTTSILFLRHPAAVVQSLLAKEYARVGGSISDKLAALEHYYSNLRDWFDLVVRYEDCGRSIVGVIECLQSRGILLPNTAARFDRSLHAIVQHNQLVSDWCRVNYGRKWGIGNIHLDKWGTFNNISRPLSKRALDLAATCCPTVMSQYQNDGGCAEGKHANLVGEAGPARHC